jgi:hypothetical protein
MGKQAAVFVCAVQAIAIQAIAIQAIAIQAMVSFAHLDAVRSERGRYPLVWQDIASASKGGLQGRLQGLRSIIIMYLYI